MAAPSSPILARMGRRSKNRLDTWNAITPRVVRRDAYIATLRRLEPLVDAAAFVVPGHGEVLEGASALLALDDAERKLGRQLANLVAPRVHQSGTSSSSRSLIIAVRIRVFTVPSGTSSRSLISRAVRPM